MKVYAIRKAGTESYLLPGYYVEFSKTPTDLPKLYGRKGNATAGIGRVVRRSSVVDASMLEVVPLNLIPENRLYSLERDQQWLGYLEQAGVDNWGAGYEYAQELAAEDGFFDEED